jgi:glycosyltransferase involved in cell wall biosynthesis
LARYLQTQKVELAHFHFGGNYGWNNRLLGKCPLIFTARLGIPCLTTNHGVFALFDGYCAHFRPTWLKLALLPGAWLAKMQVLAHTQIEVAVSHNDWRNLVNWYRPVAEKFRQIYHSQIDENEASANETERRPVIVCVGTIGQRKGQAILARAFARLAARYPDWKLILAGRQSDAEIIAKIEEVRADPTLKDRIELVENLSDAAITQLVRTASIFAMPSLMEGLGLSLQEALWQGCPAVGSRVGGIPELIEHESNGLLVPAGDEIALADGLEKLMADEPYRRRLGLAARASILGKGMTSQKMIIRYREIYEFLLRQR